MEKIKKFIKENKRFVMICGIILVVGLVIIAIFGAVSLLGKSEDNKEELTKLLEQMGKDFYEDYLYDSLTEADKQNFLERISVTGLKLDLDNLGRYDSKKNVDNIKKFVNSKTGEACGTTTTYVTIFANAPYEKTDYSVEATLDCGFEE